MTTAWVLNAVGLLAITIGALLMFLHFRTPASYALELPTPEARRAYEKDRRLLSVALGLLVAWLLIQYIGLLL